MNDQWKITEQLVKGGTRLGRVRPQLPGAQQPGEHYEPPLGRC